MRLSPCLAVTAVLLAGCAGGGDGSSALSASDLEQRLLADVQGSPGPLQDTAKSVECTGQGDSYKCTLTREIFGSPTKSQLDARVCGSRYEAKDEDGKTFGPGCG